MAVLRDRDRAAVLGGSDLGAARLRDRRDRGTAAARVDDRGTAANRCLVFEDASDKGGLFECRLADGKQR
jgi:hypothetical protein